MLARFLGRSRFAWLAEGTRQAYAKDYRLFFSFLWQRGRYWHEADRDDLLDWEAWRRRGQQPGRGIGGSKWQRELARTCSTPASRAHPSVTASETALREQNAELRRKLDDMRAERDEYKQAADALARALNVLTTENDELRRRANRAREFTGPRPLAQ